MAALKQSVKFAVVAMAIGGLSAIDLGPAQIAQAQQRQERPAAAQPAAPAQQPAAARPAVVPQPVPETFEKWTLRCFQDAKGAQACRIETVVLEANNRPQLAVTVRPPADASQPSVATVTPPWGVLLARGIDMQVDLQQAMRIPVRTCLPTGCLADFSLIDAINTQWQKGTTLKLTMAAANGQSLSIDVPLAGYLKAYARLLEKSKR
ncbi:MAG: Invasion associated locus [Alphaproteobacteria bacterium]|nr:Invasion associated locus [Alphaproteobacteria bacterium]